MKCARCQAEIPGQAQFCMQCGTPVAAVRPGETIPARPPSVYAPAPARSRKKLIAGITAALMLLAVGLFFAMNSRGGKVTEAVAAPGPTGPLTERAGRVAPAGPVTEKPGLNTPAPPDPQDVIDYLKFLREIERQRVALSKQQLALVLNWSSQMTAQNLTAEMGENPEEAHRQTYTKFQQDMAQWQTQWQEQSQRFLSYGKPVPQSCAKLHDAYYVVLGKTSGSIISVGSNFSQAMSGDPGKALESLTAMQGTASRDVDDACATADRELEAVCDKYNLHKDFDIKPDGGASNPYGVGR